MSFPIISTSDLGQIEAALASFDERPVVYDPTEIAHAGVFVSIDSGGGLRIERGFVRPEDETPRAGSEGSSGDNEAEPVSCPAGGLVQRAVITIGGAPTEPENGENEADGLRPRRRFGSICLPNLWTEITVPVTVAGRPGSTRLRDRRRAMAPVTVRQVNHMPCCRDVGGAR
jgi:hypothetical protein